MIIGIDASNIRSGGGVLHLKKLLSITDPKIYGFNKVVVWGAKGTLKTLKDRSWLKKIHKNTFEKKRWAQRDFQQPFTKF